MYSFYGGKPGNSFVIITTYGSIADMVEKFRQGPNYTAVHYDEYVMINTVNKNDPDNGKIYRRGYDFNNEETGGAEFIGTIVGPAGPAPLLEMTTISEVRKKHAQEGFENRYSSGEYAPTDNLVPGKTSSGEFNDSIKWECCSIETPDHKGNTAYIGFTFPYSVIEFASQNVSPYKNGERYNESTGEYIDNSSVQRIDDESHPFYEKFKINIPNGIKGDTLKNIRVITAAANDGVEPYTGQADDRTNSRQILVYDIYDYDKKEAGAVKTYYAGPYNMINNITVDEDTGDIIINYTYDDDSQLPVKHIKSMAINKTAGTLTVTWNDDTTEIIKDTDGNNFVFNWPKQMTINNSNGTATLVWNDNTTTNFNNLFKWINNMTINDDGTATLIWNNNDTISFTKLFKWIKNMTINNSNGTATLTWNDDTTTSFTKLFKWINNISVDTGKTQGDGTQKLQIEWNTGGNPTTIGKPINYIMDTTVNEDNHLLIKYSDPVRRAQGDENGWTDVGQINTNYASQWIEDNQLTISSWQGAGWRKRKSEDSKEYIYFIIPINLKSSINSIALDSQYTITFQQPTGGFNPEDTNISSNNTTITKSPAGLQFEIDRGTTEVNYNAGVYITLPEIVLDLASISE